MVNVISISNLSIRMTLIQVSLLVSVPAKLTPLAANVTSAKKVSLISKEVTRQVVFHVAVCWMGPGTGTAHVTQSQDSVTAKTE